jgi:hypothetical protein
MLVENNVNLQVFTDFLPAFTGFYGFAITDVTYLLIPTLLTIKLSIFTNFTVAWP